VRVDGPAVGGGFHAVGHPPHPPRVAAPSLRGGDHARRPPRSSPGGAADSAARRGAAATALVPRARVARPPSAPVRRGGGDHWGRRRTGKNRRGWETHRGKKKRHGPLGRPPRCRRTQPPSRPGGPSVPLADATVMRLARRRRRSPRLGPPPGQWLLSRFEAYSRWLNVRIRISGGILFENLYITIHLYCSCG